MKEKRLEALKILTRQRINIRRLEGVGADDMIEARTMAIRGLREVADEL